MITGHVRDQITGLAIPGALVEYEGLDSSVHGTDYTAKDGSYYIPLLSPGAYRVRASPPAAGYQPREVYGIVLPVAGYVLLNFDLRPLSDVWERGRYGAYVFRNNTVVPFYGPDVDPGYVGDFEPPRHNDGQLEPSMSAVIDPRTIASLPLPGRDVYSALVLSPAVAADNGTTRSLGLSVNGQRPSSSNFLIDGVEENDSLLSGPAVQLAPEMVQEYRVSTNNFSAEYGRTTGYIANAVTRSAIPRWHGVAYTDWNNSLLNANTFENNAEAISRPTTHQIEQLLSAGGRIPHTKILTWSAFDYFGTRGFSNPRTFTLPTKLFVDSLPAGSAAAQLLQAHPARQWAPDRDGIDGRVQFSLPVTLTRKSALERIDYPINGKQNLTTRLEGALLRRPDFNWSPYGQAPLSQQSGSIAAALTSEWTPAFVSELRASFLADHLSWSSVLPDLPVIEGPGIGPLGSNLLNLPGACCEVDRTLEGWTDLTKTWEGVANFTFSRGPHLLKFGGGTLSNRIASGFRIPSGGTFGFLSLRDFVNGNPFLFGDTVSRIGLNRRTYVQPFTDRTYTDSQPYGFIQEDWRVSSRLTLNAGLRYDRFPPPVNSGSNPDVLVTPGTGSTAGQQIAAAKLTSRHGALFDSNPDNWSVRFASSLLISKTAGTVLRGGFGTFYDRPFDNLFLTATANDIATATFSNRSCALSALYASRAFADVPSSCPSVPGNTTRFDLTMFQPGLRSPRVASYFASIMQPVNRNLTFEMTTAGSHGTHLSATDILNRATLFDIPSNGLPNIDNRTDLGASDYHALTVQARYRSGFLTLQSAYTWSRSIDNQSDPILGEYFDFGFSNQNDRTGQQYFGAFTFPGNTSIDRGNSDFDQRHNFVGWATISVPRGQDVGWSKLMRDWSASLVFALRSGLPYSVYAGVTNCQPVCNTRANLVDPALAQTYQPFSRGVQLLNPAAFSVPINGTEGTSGRNSFIGPGFSDLDLSAARTFQIPRLGELTRLTFRADFFNALNHSNLQNPEAYLGTGSSLISPQFGIATYGKSSSLSGFPALTPLSEGVRQIHLALRLEF